MIGEQFKLDGSENPEIRDLGELFLERYIQQLKDLENDFKLKMDSIDSISAFVVTKSASIELKLNKIIDCHTQVLSLLEKINTRMPVNYTM